MSPDRLVAMANQIGRFFAAQAAVRGGDARAVTEIAQHLTKFWDPRMRRAVLGLGPQHHDALDPLVRQAVETLTVPA